MATDTPKYADRVEYEPRHSALAEFGRDERRPAVLLLSALLLSALFFGIGLMVGRWTAEPKRSDSASSGAATPSPAAANAPTDTPPPAASSPPANTTPAGARTEAARRFSVLVATYDAPEKAQPLIKFLQGAGYTDVRAAAPRAGESRPRYSVLVGRFTQDEAREAVRRMRSANDPRLKNARVIQEQ